MTTLQRVALYIDFLGTPLLFFVTSIATLVGLAFLHLYSYALLFGLGLVVTTGIVVLLKKSFKAPRPRGALLTIADPAFPSGHAAGITFLATCAGYAALTYLSPAAALAICAIVFCIASSVALSRVLLKVHTPLQVIVGICIGALVPLLLITYQNVVLNFVFITLTRVV